jgi:uncharacterized protein YkwD
MSPSTVGALVATAGLSACLAGWTGPAMAQGARAPADAGRCGDPSLNDLALARLNALRAAGLACGGTANPPAAPLAWSDTLARAAAGHARDMAERRRMAHAGSDGSTGGDRLQRAGYDWQQWAENLGQGVRTVDELMRLWAASPRHCENLMLPGLQDVGLACVEVGDRRPYWSMTLGASRDPLR